METPTQNGSPTISVWDRLVRIFHWSLVGSVVAAYIFTEDGDLPHQIVGGLALAIVIARTLWGFVGSPFARFSQFVPTPRVLVAYLQALVSRKEARFVGHNPAGAVMVLLLLVMVFAAGLSGWLLTTDAFWGVGWMQSIHKVISDALMGLALAHVCGVIYTSWRHRENLVLAMLTGRKIR